MRKRIQSYRDLEVWRKGVDLAVDIYTVTRRFPALLLIAHRVGYVKRETFIALAERTDEIARMLFSLTRSIANSPATGRPDTPT